MAKLNLGIEVRDFDLERVGISLSVFDEGGKRQLSEGYLRMTLQQLGLFVDALRSSENDVGLIPLDGALGHPSSKLPAFRGIAAE